MNLGLIPPENNNIKGVPMEIVSVAPITRFVKHETVSANENNWKTRINLICVVHYGYCHREYKDVSMLLDCWHAIMMWNYENDHNNDANISHELMVRCCSI